MKQMFKFRIHWEVGNKTHYSKITAASKADALQAFQAHKLPGVSLLRAELLGPDAAAPPVPSDPLDSPFDPLVARRRLDKDEDVR